MPGITSEIVWAQRGLRSQVVVDNAVAHRLTLHQFPVDAHDSRALKTFERFWKGQKSRPRFLLETNFAEIGSACGGTHRHHAVVFEERLEMPVRLRFLPKCVHLRLAALFNHGRKADGFDLEQFHFLEGFSLTRPERSRFTETA